MDNVVDVEVEKKLIAEQGHLNGLFHQVLGGLGKSKDELKFPAAVNFNTGAELDSISAKTIPQIIQKLIEKGQLVVVIKPDFNDSKFKIGCSSVTSKASSSPGQLITAIFSPDFFSRCTVDNILPEAAVKQALIEIVYYDAYLQSQNSPRASLPPVHFENMVNIIPTTKLWPKFTWI